MAAAPAEQLPTEALLASQARIEKMLREIHEQLQTLSAGPPAAAISSFGVGRTAASRRMSRLRLTEVVGDTEADHANDRGEKDVTAESAAGGAPAWPAPRTTRKTVALQSVALQDLVPVAAANGDLAPMLPASWPAAISMRASFRVSALDTREASVDMGAEVEKTMTKQVNLSAILEQLPKDHEGAYLQFLREPDTGMHQAFELIGFFFTLYDLLVIPYSLAWDMKHSGFMFAMDWALATFWSMDIALSFITGYHDDGGLVLSLRKTCRRYLRTWFVPDVVMLICDWFVLLFVTLADHDDHEPEKNQSNQTRLRTTIKLAKLVRLVDILRILRMMRLLEAWLDRHLSSNSRMLMGMVSVAGWICYANHLIACAWFAVGAGARSDTGTHWLDTPTHAEGGLVPIAESSLVYQYVTAFHWAIAQSTLSYMEVNPTNSAERVLMCACMFAGLILGSTLISMFAATLMEMRLISRENAQKIAVLRNYLVENNVDLRLALFVQRQANERLQERLRLTTKDVPALAILSRSAREHLHAGIMGPKAIRHPLFRVWKFIDPDWFDRFCAMATDQAFLRPGDDLFVAGTEATAAYFLAEGQMNYIQEPGSSLALHRSTRAVEPGSWLCEGALWSDWIHVGTVEAVSHCHLLVVQADKLGTALASQRTIRRITCEYAKAFHQRIVTAGYPETNPPDDLEVPLTGFLELLDCLGEDAQVTVSMATLNNSRPKGLFRVSRGKWMSGELRTEVEDGRSLVGPTAAGDMERLVTVVAVHATREDGQIFAQLAKWEKAKVVVNCQLPAVKRIRGESTDDALGRLLATKLVPLASSFQVTQLDRMMSVGISATFDLKTTYMRKVVSAKVGSHVDAPLCRARTHQRLSVLSAVETKAADAFAHVPVHFIRYGVAGEKGIFASWLWPDQFEQLQGPGGDALIRRWVSMVRLPGEDGVQSAPITRIRLDDLFDPEALQARAASAPDTLPASPVEASEPPDCPASNAGLGVRPLRDSSATAESWKL